MKWVGPPDVDCITEPVTAVPPLPIQGSLFGGMPKVLEMMPELERFATRPPRIRRVQESLGVDEKAARRIYMDAERRYQHQQAYERYCHCKEYVDWRYSQAGQKTIRRYLTEKDLRYENRLANTRALHVVKIAGIDRETTRLMDVDGWLNTGYDGPMQYLVGTLKRLTRYDAAILLKRGYLQVVEGDPDTLLTAYEYPSQMPEKRPEEPIRCADCGRALHYNAVGINKKLGAKSEEHYRCIDCLGISYEQARSMVEMYRGEGCPLFV